MAKVTSAELCPSIVKPPAGSAKDRPFLGGPKKANARENRVLARMAIQSRTKCSSQLAREWGIISTLDCPESQSVVGYLSQGFTADSLENKLHWMPGTKGNVCNGPNNIARDTNVFGTASSGVINLNSVSTMLMGAYVSVDDVVKSTIKTVLSQGHGHLEDL